MAKLSRLRHFACLLLLAATPVLSATPSAARPNLVFILADDLGWTDLACQGSKYYETPHLDRLRNEGLSLSSFCVSQNCAPTRACLMSGQYAPRTGIYTVGTLERGREEDRRMKVPANETRLPLDKTTVAQSLQKAGYATGMFGKWHLGVDGPYHPGQRGFDEAIQSNGRHFNFKTNPETDIPKGAYLADYLTDLAVRFMEKHQARPFFLYLPHFGVHSPYQAKEGLKQHFAGKSPVGGHRDPTYAAMIASVDESVGRILDTLDRLKLNDRTVVIFSSDNGGVGGYYSTESPSQRRGITDNTPLRGGKGTLYEGGLRVPFLVRWPGVIPAGSTSDEPAAHVDLYPTLLELAGAARPEGYPLDGVSLAGLFRDPAIRVEREALYWHFPGYLESYVHPRGWRTEPVGVIRDGHFKLMEFFTDGRLELYNLKEDLGEAQNLAAAMPERASALQQKLAAWRTSLQAAVPERKN